MKNLACFKMISMIHRYILAYFLYHPARIGRFAVCAVCLVRRHVLKVFFLENAELWFVQSANRLIASQFGGAVNAGVENSGVENAGVDSKGIVTEELSR